MLLLILKAPLPRQNGTVHCPGMRIALRRQTHIPVLRLPLLQAQPDPHQSAFVSPSNLCFGRPDAAAQTRPELLTALVTRIQTTKQITQTAHVLTYYLRILSVPTLPLFRTSKIFLDPQCRPSRLCTPTTSCQNPTNQHQAFHCLNSY